MRVISVQFFFFSCLVFTNAHHGQPEEAKVNSKTVEHPHVSPLGSGEHHLVDISPNVLATIQSGASPIAVANSLRDQSTNNFPPNTKWPIPQSAIEFQSYLNQTANNITKPASGAQVSLAFPPVSLSDPQIVPPPVPGKPGQSSFVQQFLGSFQGTNNSVGAFFLIPSSTTAEPDATDKNSNAVMNDPLPNPIPGLINASQSTLSNATNVAQEITNQLGTNVQNGWFGTQSNRPSSDEPASGSTTSGSPNPIQSLIDNTQASWNNATGAAQNLAGQFGSNVQNGITNLFGININRPSNDEPVVQSTEASATTVEATSTAASSEASTDTTGTSSSTEQSTTGSSTTTTTTVPTPSSSGFFPLVSFVNNSQSLLNSSALVQAITSQLGTNLPSGFPTFFLPRPNRNNEASDSESPDINDPQPDIARANDVPVPVPPTCSACVNSCAFRPFQGQRIAGGSNVSPRNKYPFVALLTYLNSPSGQGSLINDRTIITTATIIENMPVIMHIRALLGVYNRADSSESISTNMINKVYIHPGYRRTNQFADNIGLLILKTPLTRFQPICLPARVLEDPPVPKATVIGWGATVPNGPLSNFLQEGELQMYPPLVCQLASPQASPQNLCGGPSQFFANIVSICKGDGGDPLVVQNDVYRELIGVALDIPGFECSNPRQPSMFTSVVPYLAWITAYGPGCVCYSG